MAISFSEPIADIASSSSTNSFSFGAFTPTANSILAVGFISKGTTSVGSISNTGTSITWYNPVSNIWNSSSGRLEIFYGFVPGSVSSSTITITSGSNWTSAFAAIVSGTGMIGDPMVQSVSGTASATTTLSGVSLIQVSQAAHGSFVFGAATGSQWASAPTGYTETADAGPTGLRCGSWYRNSGYTGTVIPTIQVRAGSNEMVVGYIEFKNQVSARSYSTGIFG